MTLKVDELLIYEDVGGSTAYLRQLFHSFKCKSTVLRFGNATAWINLDEVREYYILRCNKCLNDIHITSDRRNHH